MSQNQMRQWQDRPSRPPITHKIRRSITSNDGSVQGVIKEFDNGVMVIEKKTGELEIVNLDFVTRIRQYPRKKNGKKTDIVLD